MRKGEDKDAEQKKRSQTLVETTEQMVQATTVVRVLSQTTGDLAQRLVCQTRGRCCFWSSV
jgi:hypothetical protein